MTKIVLAILLLLTCFDPMSAYSQEPSPPLAQGQPGEMHTETSTKGDIKAENNKKQMTKTIPIVTPERSANTSNEKTQRDHNHNSNKQSRSMKDDPITTYTFWLMVFTLCLVFCNILLWWYTRKSANAAKEAADSAKKSVDTIPTIERAYVYVSSVSADFESWRNTKPNQCSPISITVRNYGKTPAKLTGIVTKLQIGKSDRKRIDWEPPEDDEIIDAVGRFIASNSGNEFFYYIHDTIGDGHYNIIFSGEVGYRDIFNIDHIVYFKWSLVSHFERGFYINDPDENYTT